MDRENGIFFKLGNTNRRALQRASEWLWVMWVWNWDSLSMCSTRSRAKCQEGSNIHQVHGLPTPFCNEVCGAYLHSLSPGRSWTKFTDWAPETGAFVSVASCLANNVCLKEQVREEPSFSRARPSTWWVSPLAPQVPEARRLGPCVPVNPWGLPCWFKWGATSGF